MRKGSTFSFFVIAVLFSTLLVLRPCEGFGASGNWDTKRVANKRALDNMCRVAREHCKREILQDDDFAVPGPRPVQ